MAPKKIVVFGVTGVQGGSVARALLEDGPEKFEVWGVTRSKTSKKAQAMEKLGVKLIEGNLDEPSSYEAGLKGADNAYINANFWDYYDGTNPDEAGAREAKQNIGAVDAAVRQGVPHVVFSSLYDFGPKFPVPHCDSKVQVVNHLRNNKIPHTLVFAAWYFSNIFIFAHEKKGDEHILQFPMPDGDKMVGFDAEQIGLWARNAFRDPEAWNGKEIHCDADALTPVQMADELSRLTGKKIKSGGLTRDTFYSDEYKKAMPLELWINYKAILDGGMPYDKEKAHKEAPGAYDFPAYIKAKKDQVDKLFA